MSSEAWSDHPAFRPDTQSEEAEMNRLLETIDKPADLRALDRKQLPQLASELREYLLESVARTGGHLSSNLGTVELTVALHYVFDTPFDRIVWGPWSITRPCSSIHSDLRHPPTCSERSSNATDAPPRWSL